MQYRIHGRIAYHCKIKKFFLKLGVAFIRNAVIKREIMVAKLHTITSNAVHIELVAVQTGAGIAAISVVTQLGTG